MADSTNILNQIVVAQAQPAVPANELFASMSIAALFSRNESASSLLTWAYYGGYYNGFTVSNGTLTLTASQANIYVVVAKATGVVSFATSTTNWNDTDNYDRLYRVTTSATAAGPWEDKRQIVGLGGTVVVKVLQFACSDLATALTAGTTKAVFRMPYGMTVTAVRASLATAQATNGAGGIFTVDINEAGTTILSTKLTIDNTEKTSTTAVTAAVISDASLADDAEITVDIDQIGDGAAKGLIVSIIGT
ncbi:MAG: hypothetical protein H0U23_13095 [Blastocatellia bacterium]|nr:hypothetical protein [Blastocatellia bacterium]